MKTKLTNKIKDKIVRLASSGIATSVSIGYYRRHDKNCRYWISVRKGGGSHHWTESSIKDAEKAIIKELRMLEKQAKRELKVKQEYEEYKQKFWNKAKIKDYYGH